MEKIKTILKTTQFRVVFIILTFTVIIFGFFLFKQIYFFKQSQNLNLILISVDTLRPDHMGIYGYNKNTTPNIDKWAKDTLVFTNARTIVPVTYPSFTALMTGTHSVTNGIINNQSLQITENINTLAQLLKTKGFHNTAFITSEVLTPELTHMNKGFDEYYQLPNKGTFENFINNALSWLENNKKKKMFYWVHFMNPHWPYEPTKDNMCRFGTQYCDTISEKGYVQLEEERKQLQAWGSQGCQQNNISKETIKMYETLYDGEIADTDYYISKFLKEIKNTGLDKNSVVVIYGDHGEGFDHEYNFTHGGVLYDSSLKIPLIIKFPLKSVFDKKSNILIDNTDMFSTLASIYGFNRTNENSIDFKSILFNRIIGPIITQKKPFVVSINEGWNRFSITDNKYKYILSDPKTCLLNSKNEELYNLTNDPMELKNIFAREPLLANIYKQKLLDYLSKYNLPQFDTSASVKDKVKNSQDLEKLKSLGY